MPIVHAIVLGIVQGLTEFLPISSSGHLILVPELLGWEEFTRDPELNKTFDVALHLGTFVGVAWYFRHDIARYIAAAWRSLRTRSVSTVDERMAWLLLLSAVPAAIVGALLNDFIDENLGEPVLIGVMLVAFGLVLFWADRLPGGRPAGAFRARDAALMGAVQALAFQPGVSRAGATISMGRWLRFDRDAATRLSFLMSLPIIAGAALFEGVDVMLGEGIEPGLVPPFVWGMVTAGISGFVAVAWLLRLLRTHSFAPFVAYRVLAGATVVVVFATGLR
ncbi:MAG TPA: undecaprenyl-diphosphate phosphatase [Acidimicrobiia bacterium]|nr:undecaprenyl-diphosphate phosphatase [Acidimicrobiia bacterium]